MAFLKRNAGILTFGLAVVDSCCVLVAYALTVHFTLPADSPVSYPDLFRQEFAGHFIYFVVFVLVWCGAATDQRLFVSRREDNLSVQLLAVLKAGLISLVFTGFVIAFFTRQTPEQGFTVLFGMLTLFLLCVFRFTLRMFLWTIRRRGCNYRALLIVGANERSEHISDIIKTRGRYGYNIIGVLEDDPARAEILAKYEIPHLGPFSALEKVLTSRVVDEVYITLTVKSYYENIQSMAHLCEGVGVPLRLVADLFPLRIATSTVHHMEDVPLLCLSVVPEAQTQLFVKRLLDLVVSSVLLVFVASWLFPIVAILTKLGSRGPVFFTQERVGLNQRRFKIIKFRSMVQDAEKLRADLEAMNEADGPVFKIKKDPRVTWVGKVLRKTSIDELPQLINVFLGQMSLVGPRPPLPSEVEQYSWDQRRRLSVKPGITGLWQVSGRGGVTFDEWVEMDLEYIDTWSLLEDFRILFRTFQVVVFGKGAA